VRFDPAKLTIDPSDYAFATSTGSVNHPNDTPGATTVTQVPNGVARDCNSNFSTLGKANDDLTGLPFAVEAKTVWTSGGYKAAGSATASVDAKTVQINGGGYCGWEAVGGDWLGGSPIYLVYR